MKKNTTLIDRMFFHSYYFSLFIGFPLAMCPIIYLQNLKLKLNDLDYFETAGFNVLLFSNQYTRYFFDEKTAHIEFIIHDVGTHSPKVAYENNRADFTFLAGGVVPGLLFLKPNFPENKED